MVYWLVKTNADQLEIWTEAEQQFRQMKCEYYGAKPFWKNLMKITPQRSAYSKCKVGEVIPYAKSTVGKHFAVILELFSDKGQKKFRGIDLQTQEKVVAPLS